MKTKKAVTLMAVTFILTAIFSIGVAYAENDTVNVTVEGRPVDFEDQPPVIIDGRTLVPVRGVFEAIGFDVDWNPQTRQVTLTVSQFALYARSMNDTVVITIDSATFTINGASRNLDVPAQVINGRTMLPIRAVLESVGYNLYWDADTRTIDVSIYVQRLIPTAEHSSVPTQQEVYERIIAMRAEYPQGMRWTNDDMYGWNGDNSYGAGCAAFAYLLSDAAFGAWPARRHTDFDNIRIGDILRINNDSHSVIVLAVNGRNITIAEGNWYAVINWERVINLDNTNLDYGYVLTRYPENE